METGVTSMSSRGQIVIPQNIRDTLGFKEGEKFKIIAENDTIVLKKVSFEGFETLLKETRKWAKDKRITQRDVDEAVRNVRHR